MREMLEGIIRNGSYQLETILQRIDYYHASGKLSNADRESLIAFAREKAISTLGNGMNVNSEVLELWKQIRSLRGRVESLEAWRSTMNAWKAEMEAWKTAQEAQTTIQEPEGGEDTGEGGEGGEGQPTGETGETGETGGTGETGETGGSGTGSEPEPQAEDVPLWRQPTGAHDAYMAGDRMRYADGKVYVCKLDNCVWSPEVYPAGWEEIPE